jgi:hypothetical protein
MSLSEKPNRRPAEQLKALEDQAESDEMDRILALGDREIDDELAALGIDAEAERARGAAMGAMAVMTAKAKRRRAVEPIALTSRVPRRPIARRWVFSLAAALGVVVAGLFVGPLWLPAHPVASPPGPPGMSSDAAVSMNAAEEIRRAAFAQCGIGHWRECLQGLDRARDIDPAGDGQADVQWRRSVAEAALGEKHRTDVDAETGR